MNSIQSVGAVLILYDIIEFFTPKPINKASRKLFGVKANRVNKKAVRAAITAAKLHQCPERYDYAQKEIIELEHDIQKSLENSKLSPHAINAVNGGLKALQIMKDALEIDPEDVKIYLREMNSQMKFLIKKGG